MEELPGGVGQHGLPTSEEEGELSSSVRNADLTTLPETIPAANVSEADRGKKDECGSKTCVDGRNCGGGKITMSWQKCWQCEVPLCNLCSGAENTQAEVFCMKCRGVQHHWPGETGSPKQILPDAPQRTPKTNCQIAKAKLAQIG